MANSTDLDSVESLLGNADMGSFRDMMDKNNAELSVPNSIDADIYAACFSTDAGRLVLEDMQRRYVNVTRAVPGQGADYAFYREGMAQVVFDIADKIMTSNRGEN